MILTIDPGVVCVGWALWSLGVEQTVYYLTACGLSQRPDRLAHASLPQVALQHEYQVLQALRQCRAWGTLRAVYVERQKLSSGRDKNAPIAKGNDLLDVQAVGAYLAGASGADRWYYPTVSDWLGSAPPHATKARVEQTLLAPELPALRAGLTGKKTVDHNVYDAVALGLWATRRLRTGHGIPPPLAA